MAGKIESGYVQSGESVLVVPANELTSVKSKRKRERERGGGRKKRREKRGER